MEKKQIAAIAVGALAGVGVGAAAVSCGASKAMTDLAMDRKIPAYGKYINVTGGQKDEAYNARRIRAMEELEALPREDVAIQSADGLNLVGHLIKSRYPRRLIIAFHGWRSGWSRDFCMVAPFWLEQHCNILFVEQRAQGNSQGDYIGFGLLERSDCRQWAMWAEEQKFGLPIYLAGISMGDLARLSLDPGPFGAESLYKLFGVQAELLIDHAWGYEPCTIAQIKAYKPETRSVSSGQVLQCPYDFGKARLVVREMADALAMDLVDKNLMTQKLTLTLGYDRESLSGPEHGYTGPCVTDRYGRQIPKSAHGTITLPQKCASQKLIVGGFMELYDRIADPQLLQRRLTLTAELHEARQVRQERAAMEQLNLFTDPVERQTRQEELEREEARLKAMLEIKKKFGKNAIFRGMNLEEGATARQRNDQIGGHKA